MTVRKGFVHSQSVPTPAKSMEICFEGVVTFPSKSTTSYRYKIIRNDDRIQFWLEDRTSKQQWESNTLGLADFPTFTAQGFTASLDEYSSIVQNCLEVRTSDASSDCKRDLFPVSDANTNGEATFRLEFTMALRVFSVVWTPTFGFEMKPIHLEPIQIAEAKIRDMEDELTRLKSAHESEKAEQERAHAKRNATRPLVLECNGALRMSFGHYRVFWHVCGEDDESAHIALQNDGDIHCSFAGTSTILLIVRHEPQNNKRAVLKLEHYDADDNLKENWELENLGKVSLLSRVLSTNPGDKLVVRIRWMKKFQIKATLVILPN